MNAADLQRVLIADSDVRVRQQLYGVLLEMHIFSDAVGSTADAVKKMDEEQYGVVIIDVDLPGSAASVLERIERMPEPLRPVVLALAATPETARTLNVDIVQIVLRRPIQLRQLVDLVQSCLRSVAARRGDRDGSAGTRSGDVVPR